MLAFKMSKNRPAKREDPLALSNEEASLEATEAKLSAKTTELERREETAARALEEERQELLALSRSRAGELAAEALKRFPAPPSAKTEPLPERLKANELRRAAIDARKTALEAEQQLASQREESLASTEETLLSVRRQIEEIRAKAVQIAEADKQAQEAAELAKTAAPPPVPKPQAAPRPPPTLVSATQTAETQNKRRYQRVALKTEVTLSSESNFYNGFSSDLSDGGIFIATCNVCDQGTEVELNFTLPNGTAVAGHGVVRWVREYNDAHPDVFPGMGIEFTQMSDEHRQAIHSFTAEREPMFWTG